MQRAQALGRLMRQAAQLALLRSEGAACRHSLPPCSTAAASSSSSNGAGFASRSFLTWQPWCLDHAAQPASTQTLGSSGGRQPSLLPFAAGGCCGQSRGMAMGPTPRFQGGKIKLSTAFKERFKSMGDGSIRLFSPGFRHRRFRKSNKQRLRLKQPMAMHQTYANTMRRMGFK